MEETKRDLNCFYLYLTDRCNLKCIHCWQSALTDESIGSLKFDDCRKFLSESADLGLKSVIFSGGEPLLNKEFPDFAEYLHSRGVTMSMETNGMLIKNGKNLEAIKKYGVHCCISLDGVKPETHNKQRGCDTAFDKTMEGMLALEEAGVYFQIIMSISKMNYGELFPLMNWVRDNLKYCSEFKINVVVELGRAKELDKELLFTPRELNDLAGKISEANKEYSFAVMLHVDPAFLSFKNVMNGVSCGGYCGFQSSLSVLGNGNISVCSLGKQVDGYVFGNVKDIDIKDVWDNNEKLVGLRGDIHRKLKGVCSNCIYKRQCLGGCRANALFEYGDIYGPQPKCQVVYEAGEFPVEKLIAADRPCSFS